MRKEPGGVIVIPRIARRFIAVMALLLGVLPVPAWAMTYTIKEFTQTRGASTFFDPFNAMGGTPPAAPEYDPFGQFFSGDETGGVLNLVTSRGELDDGEREIGAAVAVSDVFFSSGTAGLVHGVFRNLAPLPGEGYGIFIEALSGFDEAFLIVFISGAGPIAVFGDEGTDSIATAALMGLDGMGTIILRLEVTPAGAASAFYNIGAGFVQVGSETTMLALGTGTTGTHTGGFEAFEPVPEPATLLLLGSGLAGLTAWARRRIGTGGEEGGRGSRKGGRK